MTSWFDDYLEDFIHNDWRVTDDGRYFKYLEQGLIEIFGWAGQQGLWTFAFNGQPANRGWPTFAETAKAAYYASVKEELPPRVPRIPIGPPAPALVLT